MMNKMVHESRSIQRFIHKSPLNKDRLVFIDMKKSHHLLPQFTNKEKFKS